MAFTQLPVQAVSDTSLLCDNDILILKNIYSFHTLCSRIGVFFQIFQSLHTDFQCKCRLRLSLISPEASRKSAGVSLS